MNRVDRLLQSWRASQAIRWVPEGARVLDVGCFDGRLFRLLGDRLAYGVGLDPLLDRAVEEARFRLVPGAFPQDRPDGELFDVIMMLAVLEHVARERIEDCASACYDLLVPGGLVVATVPSPAIDRILDVLIRLRVLHGMSVEEHSGFKPSTAPDIFARAGFSLVRWHGFQLGLNNLFVFRKPSMADGRNKERHPARDAG
jgi:SAM-dependent methyltransferase